MKESNVIHSLQKSQNLNSFYSVDLSYSCNELAGSTVLLDSLLCELRELFGAHEAWDHGKFSLSENFEVSMLGNINDSCFLLCGSIACLFTNEGPEFVEVDNLLKESVLLLVKVSDTFLSVVSRMVFLHHDSFMMHTTGITSTAWVLSVSADSTVTVGYMTPHMSRLPLR